MVLVCGVVLIGYAPLETSFTCYFCEDRDREH